MGKVMTYRQIDILGLYQTVLSLITLITFLGYLKNQIPVEAVSDSSELMSKNSRALQSPKVKIS